MVLSSKLELKGKEKSMYAMLKKCLGNVSVSWGVITPKYWVEQSLKHWKNQLQILGKGNLGVGL